MVGRVEAVVERYANDLKVHSLTLPEHVIKDHLREFFKDALAAGNPERVTHLEPGVTLEAKPPMIDFEVDYAGETIGQLSAPALPTYGTRLRVDGRTYTVEKIVFDFDLKQLDLDGPDIVLDAPFKRIVVAVS